MENPWYSQFIHRRESTSSILYKLKFTWKFGTVIKKFDQLHYSIKLDDDYTLKRHIDQLCSTEVKRKTVRFSPDTKKEEVEINPEEKLSSELSHYVELSRTAPIVIRAEDISGEPSGDQTRTIPNSQPNIIRRAQRSHKVPSHLSDYVLN